MKKLSKNLTKRKLAFGVGRKLKYSIHNIHILNVVSLFIDQFMTEFLEKKEINIPNFCLFKIEKNKPRKYHNIQKNRFAVAPGHPQLKIKLDPAIRNEIIKHIDVIKTFM